MSINRNKLQTAIAHNPNFTESRKTSLYSNFARLEESNPEGYEANIIAWREVLDEALQEGAFADKTCIEASSELVNDLNDPANGTPLSLDKVLDVMVADNSLIPLSHFETLYPVSSGPQRSFISRVTGAFGWAAGLLYRRNWVSQDPGSNTLKHEKYVNMRAVRANAARVVHRLIGAGEEHGNSLLSQVFNFEQVKELLDPSFSDLDLKCCLSLAKANHQINYDASKNVVKLAKAGPIDDVDIAIAGLRMQIRELSAREHALASQVEKFEQEAREKIKSNRKAAKSALQKKQKAEKSYDRTLALLDQLETVLQKIDDASDNKQAMAALKSSSEILAQLNKNTNIDKVDDIIENLQEAVADTNEVTSSLADLHLDGGAVNHEMDELDLDNELAQMEDEEKAKLLNKIPDVPSHLPGKETSKSEAQKETNSAKDEEAKTETEREAEREAEGGAETDELRKSETETVLAEETAAAA